MAKLFDDVKVDGASDPVQIVGSVFVMLSGSNGGGTVRTQLASSSTSKDFRDIRIQTDQEPFHIDVGSDPVFVRAVLEGFIDTGGDGLTVEVIGGEE